MADIDKGLPNVKRPDEEVAAIVNLQEETPKGPIEITEENAEKQYGLIVRLLSLLACAVSLLFTVLVYDTILIAGGGNSLLGAWFMPIFLTGVMAPILWYFYAAFKGR